MHIAPTRNSAIISTAGVISTLMAVWACNRRSSVRLEPASIVVELPVPETGAAAVFELINGSDQPLRIVGLYRACNCLKTTSPVPRLVAANSSSRFEFLVVGDKRENSDVEFQIVTDSKSSTYVNGAVLLRSDL